MTIIRHRNRRTAHTPTKTPAHGYPFDAVGKVVYSGYWRKYALIVAVTESTVTELDAFADINTSPRRATLRTHCTHFDPKGGDRLLSVADYYKEILS